MRRLLAAVLGLAALCGIAWAELAIDGATKVKAYKMVRLRATGADDKAAVIWDVDKEDAVDLEESGGRLLMTAPPGVYKIKCRAIKLDKDGKTTVETARATVTVEGDTPDPPDPGPTPGPTPPGPTPTPAPIPLDGLRVLILFESADLPKLPAAQRDALYSKALYDLLSRSCVKEGGTAAWNIWDQDLDTSKAARHWQDAVKRAKSNKDYQTPYILISDGKTGYEGPFPKNTADALALVRKYAPAARTKAAKKGGRK